MATRMCVECKRLQDVRETGYLCADTDYVCSADCIFSWIESQEGDRRQGMRMTEENGIGDFYASELDMTFRSFYEMCFALEATRRQLVWEYEAWAFRLEGMKVYIPDFFFPDYGCFIEIKGAWAPGAKKKIKQFCEMYPSTPILVVPWVLRHEFFPERMEVEDVLSG